MNALPGSVVLEMGFARYVIDAVTLETDRQDDIEGFIAHLEAKADSEAAK